MISADRIKEIIPFGGFAADTPSRPLSSKLLGDLFTADDDQAIMRVMLQTERREAAQRAMRRAEQMEGFGR